jgi:DNA-binding MarR family transcriptional regulator
MDRRQVEVFITKKGLDLLDEIGPRMDDEPLKTITEEEAKTLNAILDKLRG